jgi:cyclopropane-fatty-acyl-phospholipid synthase
VGSVSVAHDLKWIVDSAAGVPVPIRVQAWDGSMAGDSDCASTLVFRHPRALRRLLWAPNELGMARAFVAGELDVEGDVFGVLDLPDVIARVAHHHRVGLTTLERIGAARTAWAAGALGLPPAPPAEEVRGRPGRLHSRRRDAASVSHHYDVSNEFYRLVLGPSMVYSCAYWAQPPSPAYRLDDAQRDKCALVCSKLGLAPGTRLLDVGCGWGTLAMHAAAEHDARVVGVTLSAQQALMARERVQQAGLAGAVEIRVQDYRDVTDGPYDAIASVGMSEHVGGPHLPGYASHLAGLLRPEGRLLNHAIASVRALPSTTGRRRGGFIDRYIFPDGQIVPLSVTIDALEQSALEVRDGEALREHYGLTLRAWVENLRGNWYRAQQLVSPPRARAWLLYLAACALAFEHGNLTVHQVLAVRQGDRGRSGLPATRADWLRRDVEV